MSAGRSGLVRFWRERSGRERAYLAAMLMAIAAFVYWFALVAPLRSMAMAAEKRHLSAQGHETRFPGLLAELSQRQRAAPAAPDADALQRSAAAAGVRFSLDPSSSPGRIVLRFESVPAQTLFAWLAQLHEAQGWSPLKASLRRGPAGVDGELVFAESVP